MSTNETKQVRSPFDDFFAVPSPDKAITLAIDDHMMQPLIDWGFVRELQSAHAIVMSAESLRQQNAELVRALAFVRDDLNSELDHETRLIVNAILAKVQA